MNEQRRLAAILVADVVGYSKLVGSDEAGTLAHLQMLRSDVMEPAIAKHAGRLFKAAGDGFLVEFASAVQAVEAAQAIQQANAEGELPLRIGIHVGDVVVQGDDLMGDGIDVAARIEAVADAGGIALSRQVYDQVRDRLGIAFEDRGEIELKNMVRPVHVFTVAATGSATSAAAPPLALPDKPSIAVLPFQNISGDPEQEYVTDGMVEDIITAQSEATGIASTMVRKPRSRSGMQEIAYKHWGLMDSWTPEEFAVLCIGVDPKVLDDDGFKESVKFLAFEKIRQLATRAAQAGAIKEPCSPNEWLRWAEGKRLCIPADLRDSVGAGTPQRDIGQREKGTLLKLIYGMALAKYGYSGNRGPAIQRICDDLRKCDLDVGDETIRNKLNEAVREFGDKSSGR